MSEVIMLRGAEPREILQAVVEKRIPVIMSYLSKGKWYVAKVLLTDLGADRFDIEVGTLSWGVGSPDAKRCAWGGSQSREMGPSQNYNAASPRKKPHPMNIQVEQSVGISLKYAYGKFIFETVVVGFEPSREPTGGGVIILAIPDRIELVQKRSYFRVDVPGALEVGVLLWHRRCVDDRCQAPPEHCWQGKLVDISAGGAQIAVPRQLSGAGMPDFKGGQFIGLTFTPMPYEMPLAFDAQIRNILPAADEKSICIGLQMVGLEASSAGRDVLSRLVGIVEQYCRINQSNGREQDMQSSYFAINCKMGTQAIIPQQT